MSWPVILFVVLLVALLGSFTMYRQWGYIPGAALLVATLLVGLKVFGVIH